MSKKPGLTLGYSFNPCPRFAMAHLQPPVFAFRPTYQSVIKLPENRSQQRFIVLSIVIDPTLTGSPKATPYIGGFSYFVTSITALIASGRSDLAGWDFHPLEKRRLITAHARKRQTLVYSERLVFLEAVIRIETKRNEKFISLRHFESKPSTYNP